MPIPAEDPDQTKVNQTESPAEFGLTVDPSSVTEPQSGEALTSIGEIAGYRISGEIARGGMGAVFAARDLTLDREVAIKVILEGDQSKHAVARFLRESRITAKLPHPGIPPIHALGTLPNGLPFLAMKLIRGRTLAALLAERVAPHQDVSRFVQIFEQIAQAVGFAHARGILHRDLKPANVMVGEFGEVQVMDWGLAKDLADRERELLPLDTATQSDGNNTQAGTIMGTPAYMAPEQARAQAVDARADVFALGGILCDILTGKPVFEGKSATDVIFLSAAGDTSEALSRLDACGADPELIGLVKRCLAVKPEARPRDGSDLASQVASYRTGVEERLRKAELERAAAEGRAVEERRRRRAQLAFATLVLLLLVVGGGTGWYVRQRTLQREAELVQLVEADLRDAAVHQRDEKWTQARAAVDRAVTRLADGGPETLRERTEQIRRELEEIEKDQKLLARLEGAWLQFAAAGIHGRFDAIGSDTLFHKAFADDGIDIERLEADQIAERIKQKNSRMHEPLVAFLDAWARTKRLGSLDGLTKVMEAATLADTNPWRLRLRELTRQKDWGAIVTLADSMETIRQHPSGLILLSDSLGLGDQEDKALAVLQEAQRLHPSDFWINYELARNCAAAEKPRYDEAVRYYTAAWALRPGSYEVLCHLASALKTQGKLAEAETACRDAIRINPEASRALCVLGHVLVERGKLKDALDAFQSAAHLKVSDSNGEMNRCYAYYSLGVAFERLGQLQEAETAFREALRHAPNVENLKVTIARQKVDFSGIINTNLGILLLKQKKYPEAESALREVVRLNPHYYRSYYTLGLLFLAQKKHPEAEAAFREAIRLKPDPEDAHSCHSNLGAVLLMQKKDVEAEASYREAVRLKPDNATDQGNLGTVLMRLGKHPEAETAIREAMRLDPKSKDIAVSYNNLGVVLIGQGKHAEALTALREAVRLEPEEYFNQHMLGDTLRNLSKFSEAEAAYRAAIRLQPDSHAVHHNLGDVLSKQRKFAEAETAFREAYRLKENDDSAFNLGKVLSAQGKMADAILAYRDVVRLKPHAFEAHYELGAAYQSQNKLREAVAAYREAILHYPSFAPAHNNLGQILRDKGKRSELMAAYDEALRVNPREPDPHFRLGEILKDQGKLAEAMDKYRTVLELDPKHVKAHFELGMMLRDRADLEGAAAHFRKAVESDPKFARGYLDLGIVLHLQGKFQSAHDAIRQSLNLFPPDGKLRPFANFSLGRSRGVLEHEKPLAEVLAGTRQPTTAAEAYTLADLCRDHLKRYAAAVPLYTRAFELDPQRADDLQKSPRYSAALAAVLAGTGKGNDAPPENTWPKLRLQAMTWLQADLAAYRKLVVSQATDKDRPFVHGRMQAWQKDSALAPVRDAIDRLPEDERADWRKLWQDVADLLQRTAAPK